MDIDALFDQPENNAEIEHHGLRAKLQGRTDSAAYPRIAPHPRARQRREHHADAKDEGHYNFKTHSSAGEYCRHCGKQLPPNANVCPYCGKTR